MTKAEPVAWKCGQIIVTDLEDAVFWRNQGFTPQPLYTLPDATRIAELEGQLTADRAKAEDWQAMKDERDGAQSGYANLLADTNGEIAGLRAKVESFKAGNRDLQLHFDVVVEDMKQLEADATRWREVAGELAGVMQKAEPHLDGIICYASTMDEHEPNRIAHDFRAALARFKQESGQ